MKSRYYHYDRERCAFVEVRVDRGRYIRRTVVAALGVLLLATGLTWSLDRVFKTPEEVFLIEKVTLLEEHIAYLDSVIVAKESAIAAFEEMPLGVFETSTEVDKIRAIVSQHAQILESMTDLNLADRMTVPLLTQSVNQLRREQERVWTILIGILVTALLAGASTLWRYMWGFKAGQLAIDSESSIKRQGPGGSTIVEFPRED